MTHVIEAEDFIAKNAKHLTIARIALELAPLAPQSFFVSKDLIDALGDKTLAYTFAIGAWDLDREADGKFISGEITSGEDDRKITFDIACPYLQMPGADGDEMDFTEAIASLKTLDAQEMAKVIGRLVDVGGGIILNQKDSFERLSGKGFVAMANEMRNKCSPKANIRFTALALNSGNPERGMVCQVMARGPEAEVIPEEQRFVFDMALNLNEDRAQRSGNHLNEPTQV